ncbi:SDR family NAD(P)-dependent oxidoreductase [Blastococcus sp. SYSU D00820]
MTRRPVAVVTGAAGAIGRAVAVRLGRGGHDVVAVDREPGEETVAAVVAAGGRARAERCLVTL